MARFMSVKGRCLESVSGSNCSFKDDVTFLYDGQCLKQYTEFIGLGRGKNGGKRRVKTERREEGGTQECGYEQGDLYVT